MSGFTFTISVPPLPDTGVWFANADAWNSYWNNGLTLTLNPVSNSIYVPIPTSGAMYVNIPFDSDGDGIAEDQIMPTKSAFDLLMEDYKNLKQALKNAGVITNSY